MSDIPERLRDRAKAIFKAGAYPWAMQPTNQGIEAIATALHEIEQAARAEGERAGAEAMREKIAAIFDANGREILAATIRELSLPAPAVPAKEA